ncbi:MAG TPA: PfkB family carbohydrate kinase [Candidatus Acidoferrales bacterium]|nr:PfkB family carbohydrate kinase [Candidatus Acidoferrales bacterium]
MSEPVVCTIGTTEAHLAVGLGVDLRVLVECEVRPLAVVAALSAQDAAGLRALEPVAPEMIAAQLASLRGARIDAFRIGALAEVRSATVIARGIAHRKAPIVYDPVAGSSAGGAFAPPATLCAIADELLALRPIITPNLYEAGLLTQSNVDSIETMIAAARALRARGAQGVLIKGGHLTGAPRDVLVADDQVHLFEEERLPGEMRATGCVLAAALAAALAHGATLLEAVQRARAFVREKMTTAHLFDGMQTAY